jgi:adenosylcobinamide-GDP ribazoletransferase
MRELRLIGMAVMFYTRIPVPRWVGYSDEDLNASTRYFPLVGAIVGGVVAGVIWAVQLVLPLSVAIILGLAAGVLLTGGFHEDGFADVCDGFGGGTSRERTLEIMKDSRVGAFGVIGIVLLFALKFFVLDALIPLLPLDFALTALVFAHVLSRWCVTTIIFTDQYARADATSKVKPIGKAISLGGMLVATLWPLVFVAVFPLLFEHVQPWWVLAAVVPALGVRVIMGAWFKRRLGGYTGDCLGAAQQVIEQVVLLWILGVVLQTVQVVS